MDLPKVEINVPEGHEIAIFAGGCFWCTEAIFNRIKGVIGVKSGYSGGHKESPTYQQVTTGTTGHAECIKILFDPNVILFRELLEVFCFTHDPTTLNRQGGDVGPQYRSAVFYISERQREEAELYKRQLTEQNVFKGKPVTEITPYTNFYEAEKYHDQYFDLNGHQPYCQLVIDPKIQKFKKLFSSYSKLS